MTQDIALDENTSGFEKFDFEKAIMKSLKAEGFDTPTPIQNMAILPAISGGDLIGIAQTGSGKTAAFSLPTINKLIHDYQKPQPHHPKALILAPTRELVMQIGKFIDRFSRGTPVKSLIVAGGQSYQPQIRKLKAGIDILISTPGRLIDHMKSGNVNLAQCHTFILDEADRMLDMGFVDDVREIRKTLTEDHQTIMFSATMNDKVRKLSGELLKNPEYVEQERTTVVADTITHKLMNVRRKNKTDLLVSLLRDEPIEKALVFARTKVGADKLCEELKHEFEDTPIRIDAIHGDKKQRVREKILLNFRKGKIRVLVATDVAARGIDVDGISHVINYELPVDAENYVHRIGRTGRAGEAGLAISFCDPSDVRLLKEIEKLIKIKVEIDDDHKYHFEQNETDNFANKRRRKKSGIRNRTSQPFAEKKTRGNRASVKRATPMAKESGKKDVQKPSSKPIGKKKPGGYDPIDSTFGFDHDPVLEKLRSKSVKRGNKKAQKTEEEKKKNSRNNVRNNAKNDVKQDKHRKTRKIRGKSGQTGGHNAYSPKRKGK